MKRITIYSIEYWTNKGFSVEESIKLIEKTKKETSCWNKEFWIVKKGYTEEEAIKKVQEVQSKNSRKRDISTIKNVYLKETWIEKGYTEEESIKKVELLKDSCNIYKKLDKETLDKIKNNRSITFYSKTEDERKKINKSKGRTKEELTIKFGEEYVNELSLNRGKGRKNSFFRRYSKLSEKLFNELQLLLDVKLFYGDNEKWIRYDKNNGYFVDLIIDKTKKIIEFNGDFYHANPNMYEPTSIITISKNKILIANEIWEKDKIKIDNLTSLGYEILIIWEQDLLKNKEYIINKCVSFIKK